MFLIARISTDGHDCVQLFAKGCRPSGEPRFAEVQELLTAHGYEATLSRKGAPAEWPLVVVAYKSRNREGVGRATGQFYTWAVRKTSSTV